MDILPEWVSIIFVSVFGLALGSFVSAISWRIPRNISIFSNKDNNNSKRSICPKCKTELSIKDLVPIFSWLLAKGKCRHCLKIIPVRYPLIELSTASLLILFYISIPEIKHSWALLAIFTSLTATLMSMAVIDLEHKILPNNLNLTLAIIGFAYIAYQITSTDNVISVDILKDYLIPPIINIITYAVIAIFIRWIFLIITKKDALGGGDIKFFAATGIWLSLQHLPIFMMITGFGGIIIGSIWKKLTGENIFPFGPALIISLIICLIAGDNILKYLL